MRAPGSPQSTAGRRQNNMQADAMCIGYAMVLKMQLKFPFIFSVNFIQHNYMQTTHCTKGVSQE